MSHYRDSRHHIFRALRLPYGRDPPPLVLQEIPYKSNVTWEEHELFRRFRGKYDANEYDVIFDISSISQIKMTVSMKITICGL